MTETAAPFVPAPNGERLPVLAQFHSVMADFLKAQERVMLAALAGMDEDAVRAAWPVFPSLVPPGTGLTAPSPDRGRPALLARHVPVARAQPIDHLPDDLPTGFRVLLRPRADGFHRAVISALARAGATPVLMPASAARQGLAAWLAGLDPGQAPQALVWLARPDPLDLADLDDCLAALAPHLAEGGRILGVMEAGGRLGLRATGASAAGIAGLAELMAGLARDWPGARVKTLDLDPAGDEAVRAQHVLRDLSVPQATGLAGHADGTRTVLRLEPASLSPPPEAVPPGADWVILAMGCAEGPAAAALEGFARFGARLVLAEGWPAPGGPGPAVDAANSPWLDRLRASGARLERIGPAPAEPGSLVRQVLSRHGRIDLVLHAPLSHGRDSAPRATVEAALTAHLAPVQALAGTLNPAALAGLVLLLPDPAARTRSEAAAIAALNGLSLELSTRWGPGVAVKAITLCPPPGQAAAEMPGLGDHVVKDLMWSPRDEVLSRLGPGSGARSAAISAALSGTPLPPPPGQQPLGAPMVLLRGAWRSQPDRLTWRFDLGTAPYVDHHRFDGVPVMPIAVMMQMLMELPRAFGETRIVTGLRHVQLFQGLTLAKGPMELDFVLEEERPGGLRRASVFSRDAPLRPHYRADLILDDRLPPGTEVMPRIDPGLVWNGPDIATVYRRWLSHGPVFQTLDRLAVLTDRLVLAQAHASRPTDFLDLPEGVDWDVDPAVADGLLQAIWTWARVKQGASALPLGVKGVRRFDGDTREGPLTAECRILSRVEDSHCVADLLVFDARGRLCFLVDHFIGQSTTRLNRLGGGWQGGERETAG